MAGTGQNGGFLVDFQPMSPEEMQRAMQFLVNQQAQFAADIAKNAGRAHLVQPDQPERCPAMAQ